jgi:hypothetical protein
VTISIPFGELAVGVEQDGSPFDAVVDVRPCPLQLAPDLGTRISTARVQKVRNGMACVGQLAVSVNGHERARRHAVDLAHGMDDNFGDGVTIGQGHDVTSRG